MQPIPLPWYIVLLISVPETFLVVKLGFRLYNLDISLPRILLLSMIGGILAIFARGLPLPFGAHTLLIIILLTLLTTMITRTNLWYSFVSILTGSLIGGVLQSALLPPLLTFTSRTVTDLDLEPWLNPLYFLPFALIMLTLYFLAKKRHFIIFDLRKNRIDNLLRGNGLLIISTLLVETLFTCIINQQIYISQEIGTLKAFLPFASFIILVLSGLAVFSIREVEETARKRAEVQLLKAHLCQVEELLKTLQTQKHEHSRHIQTIQAMLYLEEVDKAKEYIDGIAERYWHSEDFVNVGHPALTALLNSKRKVAETKEIDFAFAVKCNPANINMHPWDLCSLVGNLLENALEAALRDPVSRQVAIEIKYEDAHQYVMYVYNTGPKISEKVKQKLFQPGYTTKESNARGYGLYLVKRLVDMYGGRIEVQSGERTSFIVYLPEKGGVMDDKDIFSENSHDLGSASAR